MARFAHITRRKAGSQWVKDLLSDPAVIGPQGVRFSAPGNAYSMDDFAREPAQTFVAPMFDVTRDAWQVHADPADRCVVVLRDPRDAVVSWTFSTAFSHVTDGLAALIRPTLLSLDLRGQLEVAAFLFFSFPEMNQSWSNRAARENELVVRFEDLLSDEFAVFRCMVDHFGWNVPDEVLGDAVARLTFKSRSGGRERGEKNEFSHFRNGTAGDWRNYFDRDLARRLEEAAPGFLRRLGYATDDRWWMAQPETIERLGLPAGDGAESSASREIVALRADLEAVRAAAQDLLDELEA